MIIAHYARYSARKQGDGYSIETQLECCRKRLGEGDKAIEYVDRAKSGTTVAGRTELLRMLADAEKGKFKKLLVYKFDRLGRNQAETATIIQHLEDNGISVESVTEGNDFLARGVSLVINEHYSRQLAERTRAGVIKAAASGHIGGPAPYGYRRDGNRQLEVDPATGPIAKRIFLAYAGHSCSYKGICRMLNAEKIPSPRGGQWRTPTLHEMFGHTVYMGKLAFNQRRFRRNRKTGKRIYSENPKEEWQIIDRPDLAIVSVEVWEAIQSRRFKRQIKGSDHNRTYPLSGVVICSECGRAYVTQKSGNKKGVYAYMTCGTVNAGGNCGNRFRFREDWVREEMVRRINEAGFSPDAIARARSIVLKASQTELEECNAERVRLTDRVAEQRKRVSSTMELMLQAREKKDGTESLWAARLALENRELQSMLERQKELESNGGVDLRIIMEALEETIEEQRAGLIAIEEPERIREAIRAMTGNCLAHPDRTITYNTQPANLLGKVGGLRTQVVAGARLDTDSASLGTETGADSGGYDWADVAVA